MHALTTALLDLVFPPCCPCCQRIMNHSRMLACPRCFNDLTWLPEAETLQGKDVPCVAAGWYQGNLRKIIHTYKFEGQRQLAAPLALHLAPQVRQHYGEAFDLITWVPVSSKTLKARGYDQSQLLAQTLAAELGRTAVPLLQKQRHTPAQSSLASPASRRSNIAGAFAPIDASLVAGQRILLVDDVTTTGATLKEISRILRRAGADRVMCAALCRTPPSSEASPEPW